MLGRVRGWVSAALLAVTLAGALQTSSIGPAAAAGESGEVTAAEDNPPGCKKAIGEDPDDPDWNSSTQCGAQGRDHFASSVHRAPITACKDIASPAGSLVTRVRPEGPRRADNKMAFIPGACVYLPPGYATSGLRYPVVYLLHGGGGDQADWVTYGSVQKMLDGAYAASPANAMIAVMPDGRNGQWYNYADDTFLLQTYLLDYVLPFVDRRFRTIPDRRGRAVSGLSNGGYGALHLAARAPDRFRVAGSMSGNLGAYDFKALYTEIAPGVKGAATYFQGNLPRNLVPNLDPVDLTIDLGTTCMSDAAADGCATWAFEQTFLPEHRQFRDELIAKGYAGKYEYRETEGGHSWRWWTPWLRDRHLPFFRERLSPPEPDTSAPKRSSIPATFRYRSVNSRFSVWGYDVASLNRPGREFLELKGVTVDGLTLVGSGAVEITTAARYTPGGRYLVAGAGVEDTAVVADGAGRLRLAANLGPGHTKEEYYTPEGESGKALGGYFTERKITLTADPSGVTRAGASDVIGGPTSNGESSPSSSIPDDVDTFASPGGIASAAPASQAATPAATSAPQAGPSVPALMFLVFILVVGFMAGFADRLNILRLGAVERTPTIVLGLVGSIVGGVLGYVLVGFDFDGGALQPAGVMGSLLGAAVAVGVPALMRKRGLAARAMTERPNPLEVADS